MKNKLMIIWLVLIAVFTGCGRQDTELTKRIPGTWRQEMRAYTNTLTIAPDGTFAYTRITTNIQSTFTNAGTWRIRGGSIVLTATNRVGDHLLPLGLLFKAKIVRVDEHVWEFQTGDGPTGDFKR